MDNLALGQAVRYAFDDGDHMDGIVIGVRNGDRHAGVYALPGCDEDCAIVEFLVVDMTVESVILACAPESLLAMHDAELRDFLLANLAALPTNADAPTKA